MSSFRFGSHLPVLMKVVQLSDGPILEMGSGIYSTVFLHWACFNDKRKLTTLESKWKFYKEMRRLRCDWHEIEFVKHWEKANIEGDWSVVLLDQGPGRHRGIAAKQLTHVDYLVLHDSDQPFEYGYDSVYPLFKYRFDYVNPERATPSTTVLSNKHNLDNLLVRGKLMLQCEDCGKYKLDVKKTICPYAEEVDDKIEDICVCNDCWEERSDNI